jgi:hypothetical protein
MHDRWTWRLPERAEPEVNTPAAAEMPAETSARGQAQGR